MHDGDAALRRPADEMAYQRFRTASSCPPFVTCGDRAARSAPNSREDAEPNPTAAAVDLAKNVLHVTIADAHGRDVEQHRIICERLAPGRQIPCRHEPTGRPYDLSGRTGLPSHGDLGVDLEKIAIRISEEESSMPERLVGWSRHDLHIPEPQGCCAGGDFVRRHPKGELE